MLWPSEVPTLQANALYADNARYCQSGPLLIMLACGPFLDMRDARITMARLRRSQQSHTNQCRWPCRLLRQTRRQLPWLDS